MAFDTTVFIPLDPYAVYDLVTQPERLRRWKTVASRIDLQVGGEYRWTITPGHSAAGNVVDLIPGKKVTLSWGWEGQSDLPPGASIVTITLEGVTGGTNLRLVHDGLNAEQAAGHAQGWDHYLARLVAYSATGQDVADPWKYAPENLDAFSILEAVLVTTQQILANVTPSDFEKPTPCPEMNVGQLFEHLYRAVSNLTRGLGLELTDDSQLTPEVRFANLAARTIEAFRLQGLTDDIDLRFAIFPAPIVSGLIAQEILIHGWDIAIATNQPYEISDVVANYVLSNSKRIISEDFRARGAFGPAIAVSGALPPLQQLIAFTGRKIDE